MEVHVPLGELEENGGRTLLESQEGWTDSGGDFSGRGSYIRVPWPAGCSVSSIATA
jgi:hypothetical protein